MVDDRDARSSGVFDPARFGAAASAITAAIRADPVTRDQLVDLLIARGRLSVNAGESSHLGPEPLVVATLARFTSVVERILHAALTRVFDDDDEHLAAIRRFFLQPQERYSVDDLAALWRIHPDDVRDIYHDQRMRSDTEAADLFRIAWADAVGTSVTFNILRPFDIERALGADFVHAQSEAWRTLPVLIHVPRFIADAVARDASIPPNLALDVRIEQILLEVFASGEYARGDVSLRRSV
jgi:hypothetical protein